MKSTEKLWSRNFILVFAINFMFFLIFFSLLATIAVYAVETFHVSTSMAGLLSGLFVIGALIGRLGAGRLIQTVGSKKILFYGILAFLITTGFYLVANNLPLYFLNRLFHGVAFGIASTATGTIIVQIIPPARRGEGIGFYSLSSILSTAIGPLIGIQFTHIANGFTYVFLLNFLLAAICLVLYGFVKPPSMEAHKSEEQKTHRLHISQFIEMRALPIALIAMILGFVYSSIMSFISFYTEDIQLVKAGSFFFLVYAIVVLFSRPFTGKVMDRKGSNIVIYPCMASFFIGMLLYSQAQNGVTLLLGAALIAFGYGSFNSIAQAIAIKVTPVHRFSLATSTYFIFFDLGLGIGPYFFGLLVPFFGYRGIYLIAAGFIMMSIVLYHFLHGRKDKDLIPLG